MKKILSIILLLSFALSLTACGTLSIISLVFAYVCAITIRKDGVAIEIMDNKLILYKKHPIEISIKDILKISIHDGDGSFDISIKTPTQNFTVSVANNFTTRVNEYRTLNYTKGKHICARIIVG